MTLTPSAYTLLGLTAMVAALVAVLMFAMLRFAAAARETRRGLRGAGAETAFLSAALQEAVTKLKAQERATAARADASERLNGEIISSLTAGLVDGGPERRRADSESGRPADARSAGGRIDASRTCARTREQPLLDVIDESLKTGTAIVRRGVTLPDNGHGVTHLGVTVSPLFDEHDAARRHLSVHGPHRREGSRGAAASEGEPGGGRRADRRHRARIPQRPGDDSRLQQAVRSECAAAGLPALCRRHPRRDRVAQPGRDQLPQLRTAGTAHARRAST